MKSGYELLEHTADIRIRVEAADLKALFSASADALFDIMAERAGASSSENELLRLEVRAENLEELFIAWLNELISRSVSDNKIFTHFSIDSLTQTYCAAGVVAESISRFRIKTEVKAATYHQLMIAQIPDGWRAEVIFDV